MANPHLPRPASRVVFRVQAQRYALSSHSIVEVVPRVPLVRVALAQPEIAGLFEHRGSAVPVVDLWRLLSGQDCPDLLSSRIAVIEISSGVRRRRVGLLAEGFSQWLSGDAALQPGLDLSAAPFLGALLQDNEGIVQLIDAENILSATLLDTLLGHCGVATHADDPACVRTGRDGDVEPS